MELNERLVALRKSLGLTQEEFGERLGIGKSAVSRLESGSYGATETMLKLICQTYHVNYLWLTEGKGEMLEAETPAEMVERLMAGESPLAISIMKAFAELPMEEWLKLRKLIDEVKENGLP